MYLYILNIIIYYDKFNFVLRYLLQHSHKFNGNGNMSLQVFSYIQLMHAVN